MLQNMHIKNIVLIDDIDISFFNKLNILTGETGAGKSIIIGSVGICLGGRFSKELLRDETKEALVELSFSVDDEKTKENLNALGITMEDDEVLISRKIGLNGKTITRINGESVTTAVLKQAAAMLIDLHAQHEQQTLLKEDMHIKLLDDYAGEEINPIKNKVSALYREYINIKNELVNLTMDEGEKAKQLDFLKYQIDEIKNAALRPSEDDELEAYYKRAENSKEILSVASDIYAMTDNSPKGSARDMIERSISMLRHIVEIDPELDKCYELLNSADEILADFNREFASYMEELTFDEREFYQAEARLNQINSMKLKYGQTIEEIQEACLGFETEYEKLLSIDEKKTSLQDALGRKQLELESASKDLTLLRKKWATCLCNIICASMQELNFETVSLSMDFSELKEYTPDGVDMARFMLSTNVGEVARPLSEIASGGELSRIMLAIKSSLASKYDTPTLIFDEIDVGISGRTAQKVAEKLSLIANNHQVICITHLPQIAAMADAHYVIEKNVENNKTSTNIRHLSDDEEIDEIARLIGGVTITDATLISAKEIKGLADSTKLY